MSRKPGLGFQYTNTHKDWQRKGLKNYTQLNGIKGRLPRYLKEKIFSSWEIKRMSITAKRKAEEDYNKKIQEMSKYSDNPHLYYDQVCQAASDRIAKRSKENKKI